MFFYNGMRYMN